MQVTYYIQSSNGQKIEPKEGTIISRSVVVVGGAGTELKNLIAKFGLRPGLNCKCGQHIREMDQNGVEWCEQNIDTISGWLHEEAQRANLPFFAIGANVLIRRAIANSKRKQKGEQDMTVKLVVEIDTDDVYDALTRTKPAEGKVTAATAEPARVAPAAAQPKVSLTGQPAK